MSSVLVTWSWLWHDTTDVLNNAMRSLMQSVQETLWACSCGEADVSMATLELDDHAAMHTMLQVCARVSTP